MQILTFRGNLLHNLRQLEHYQWFDQKHTHALQQENLKRLLTHAYHHVPYYRKILVSSGVINDANAINLKNFSQIPLLDKSIIRKHYEELKSDNLSNRKWYENTSGGSTGEPARFIQDKDYQEMSFAIKFLFDQWSGFSIGERKILLWGSERDLLIGRETLRVRLRRWLSNEIWLNTFKMSDEQMLVYVKHINSFKPVQILAYAESIYELSHFIERKKLKVYSPKAIMTSAGTLYEYMREKIQRVFNAPIFNRYGSREVGDIACECDNNRGLHVSAPTHFLEIIRSDGTYTKPGEVGEIVITLLTNYAMPLIRYRIGDMGMWADAPCTCGRVWPLLVEITGRTTDNFVTRGGAVIYGGFFRYLLFYQDWIKKYQIIQEDYNNININVVLSNNSDSLRSYEDKVNEIKKKINYVMGKDCNIKFNSVKNLEPTPSGKYRYIISKIKR